MFDELSQQVAPQSFKLSHLNCGFQFVCALTAAMKTNNTFSQIDSN